jgi:hypothetical protein
MRHDHLFAFESDFVTTLRCVPMAVRFKLDRVGVKLTLRQWSRFAAADRRELLSSACRSSDERKAYRARLKVLVRERTGEVAKPLPTPEPPVWETADGPPAAVTAFAEGAGVPPPSREAWRRLARLQRFVLVKLSRDNHDNVNFVPALREFGLFEATGRGPARHQKPVPVSSDGPARPRALSD